MQRGNYKRNRFSAALFVCAFLAVTSVQAANVSLWLDITEPLIGGDGQALVDGSHIVIIGNIGSPVGGMPVGEPMQWSDTQGGDVILAVVTMQSVAQGRDQGEMLIVIDGIAFNTEDINYLYLRFFDGDTYSGFPPVGDDIAWGETDAVPYTTNTFLNIASADIAGGVADQTNTFTIIPEPGTAHLFVVAGLVVAAFCARRDRKKPGTPAQTASGPVDRS